MKTKNILKHPSELRRTLKAFFTFYKHLFGKESKINKSKFKSRLVKSGSDAKSVLPEKNGAEISKPTINTKVSQKESVM
jgi:hypothetical protein